VLVQAYDVLRDDAQLRELRLLSPQSAAAEFDRLRGDYLFRPEFNHFVVGLAGQHVQLADRFRALGFNT
jgi:hypothetical protein